MNVFKVINPKKKEIPFILSIPHSGTSIPNEKVTFFNKKQLKGSVVKGIRNRIDVFTFIVFNKFIFS